MIIIFVHKYIVHNNSYFAQCVHEHIDSWVVWYKSKAKNNTNHIQWVWMIFLTLLLQNKDNKLTYREVSRVSDFNKMIWTCILLWTWPNLVDPSWRRSAQLALLCEGLFSVDILLLFEHNLYVHLVSGGTAWSHIMLIAHPNQKEQKKKEKEFAI